MVVLLAYYKLRPDVDRDALAGISRRMYDLANGKPEFGFRGGTTFKGTDGQSLTIYEFDHMEGLERFRLDPEHAAVQRRGHEFFEWLRNDVCVVERQDPMGAVDP
jgi:hypothetical protein